MIVDLTHVIHDNMPVYPGTEKPSFEVGTSIEKDGFLERKISFFSHTGTHIDSPAHVLKNGKTLDKYNIDYFIGEAICIDVRNKDITKDFLMTYEEDLKKVKFVLFRSGWSKFWEEEKYFKDFPTLTNEAAHYLSEFDLHIIGLDMISIDSVEKVTLPNHRIILSKNTLIIENLTNLDKLPYKFNFYAMPLYLEDSDGAPIRAIATF